MGKSSVSCFFLTHGVVLSPGWQQNDKPPLIAISVLSSDEVILKTDVWTVVSLNASHFDVGSIASCKLTDLVYYMTTTILRP